MHGIESKGKLFEKKSNYCGKTNWLCIQTIMGKSCFKWNASYWSSFEF